MRYTNKRLNNKESATSGEPECKSIYQLSWKYGKRDLKK